MGEALDYAICHGVDLAGSNQITYHSEATTREITSAAYKRAQRRNERDIQSFMGRARGQQPVRTYKR
ncbi:hypothetical protein [Bifidobacterium saguinibicoloris]|uniref:hypothetical protein n=1 Tax=Bifidobacterium saguinibicoloris TaxID=2834433 RepID=UPI001C5726D4|nr:hypothetical protein [Bifidobacterium saguinibicoloris]MBW3079876.1 hypothetical protein [Bifidobacterium saguinibicoloris]